MSDIRKLAHRTSHYAGGRVVLMLLGFVSFPIFTRVFTIEQYGAMSLVNQLVLAFTSVAKGGLQNSVQRYHREHAESDDRSALLRFYSTNFAGSFLIGLITMVLFIAVALLIPPKILSPYIRDLLLIASPLLVIRAVKSMFSNLLQVEGRTKFFNALDIGIKVFTIAGILALFFWWEKSVRAFFLATLAVELVSLLVLVPYVLRRKLMDFSEFHRETFSESFRFGFPLMWAELSTIILDSGDRILVEFFLGSVMLGLYSAAYGIAQYVFDLLVTPLNLAFFPICMDLWVEKGEEETKKFITRSIRYFLVVGLFIQLITVLIARDLIVILASRKYELAHEMLPYLVGGMVLASAHVFFKAGLMIRKKTRLVAGITIIAMITNIVMNIVLLPRIGVMAAAYSTVACYGLWAVLCAVTSWYYLNFEVPVWDLVKYSAVAAVTALLVLRVHFDQIWIEITVRAALGTLVFATLILATDRQMRTTAVNLFRQATGRDAELSSVRRA